MHSWILDQDVEQVIQKQKIKIEEKNNIAKTEATHNTKEAQ